MIRRLLFCWCLVLTAWAGPAWSQTYHFGVTDLEGLAQVREEWGAFRDVLQARTGIRLEFVPMSKRDDALRGFADKTLDIALTGPAEYVVLHKRTNASVLMGFSRPDYFSVIVTLADGGIKSIADLKGKKVGFNAVGSTSGHLAPMQIFRDLELDPLRDIVALHASSRAAWEALLRGDLAAMATSDTAFRQLRAEEDGHPAGAFRVLARSGDLPGDLLMVAAHVPPDEVTRLREVLLEHAPALIQAIVSHPGNAKYQGMQFLRSMEDQDYDCIRAMYGAAGFPAYADFLK